MMSELKLNIKDLVTFKKQLLSYGNKLKIFVFMDSCSYENKPHSYLEYDFVCAINSKQELQTSSNSCFDQLKQFNNHKEWIFGYLSYDLKNEIENLQSKNIDELLFADIHFFIPEIVIYSKNNEVSVIYDNTFYKANDIIGIIDIIKTEKLNNLNSVKNSINLKQRFSKDEYIETVKKLKNHIQLGDIYEINFCQEFYSETEINPHATYIRLRDLSPTPFSCYYKHKQHYLLSASPERYLKKLGRKIISQPIKGTKRRGKNKEEDQLLIEQLLSDPKERAENVMIVDLVRNDLSKTAKKGSVKVEELYGVYTFKQVHQLISTVVSEIESNTNIIDVIQQSFPMGSMTGAPKVKAMELIETYEKTKRGLYSGAVGFITPEKDFDFNVVIRSILYNELKKHVSFTVGGAITSLAVAEQEYDECMVKAKAMIDVLK